MSEKNTILIVDDKEVNREFLKRVTGKKLLKFLTKIGISYLPWCLT